MPPSVRPSLAEVVDRLNTVKGERSHIGASSLVDDRQTDENMVVLRDLMARAGMSPADLDIAPRFAMSAASGLVSRLLELEIRMPVQVLEIILSLVASAWHDGLIIGATWGTSSPVYVDHPQTWEGEGA